ncbi:MAG: metal ABC transporter permease [bacterium]|nr:metal ABC transporter permease [bacterium]
MEIPLIQSLLIALTVGLASGAVGSFVVLKRMALVGDAFSHIALPGIALAIAWNIEPFWGVIVSLVLGAFIIFKLEQKTRLPIEAIVGLLFTASLAIGILILTDHEVIEALFGGFPQLSINNLMIVLGTAILMTVLCFLFAKKFIFNIVSPEIAKINGLKPRENLLFLLIFAIIVSLGIKLVGTLLMGALTIIPASIARNTNRSVKSFILSSTLFGALISVGGVMIAYIFNLLPGPTIIILGITIFLISLFLKK